MRVERIYCVGNNCEAVGEASYRVKVDYVFAFAPASVRYSPGLLTVDFGAPVECERFRDDENDFTYLLCAPVVRDHRIEFDSYNLPVIIDLEVEE